MYALLAGILDVHGGLDRWHGYKRVDATIVSGGGLFLLKGVPQDATPRRMSVWLHEECASVAPYGAPDQRTLFTPDWVASTCHNTTIGQHTIHVKETDHARLADRNFR